MSQNPTRIILLVNDSYFSYLLAKDLMKDRKIHKIIFSKSIKNSNKKIYGILKKASLRFFSYRVLVFILTKFFYKKYTVKYVAKKYNIDYVEVNTLKEFNFENEKFDIGFAFNFDIIINENFFSQFRHGIFNIHASKLPLDKGISPVLWAFARGDKEIWSTIYKIDKGIDTGDIFQQFKIELKDNDSAFSLYERVCEESGQKLSQHFTDLINEPELFKPPKLDEQSYFSWPNKQFDNMLKENHRKLIKLSDLLISKK